MRSNIEVTSWLRGLVTLAAAATMAAGVPPTAAAQTAYVASWAEQGLITLDTVSGAWHGAVGIKGLSYPGAIAIAPDGRTAYIETADSVTPVVTATNTALSPIAVSGGPVGIAMSPDGQTVYVATTGADGVTPIDTSTNRAGPIIAVSQPAGIAIAPDGRHAYVLSAGNTVTPIDLVTKTALAPITIGHTGRAIAVTPDGSQALIAEADDPANPSPSAQPSYLQPIALPAGTALTPVALNNDTATAIAIAPNGHTAYIAEYNSTLLQSILPFDLISQTPGSPMTWGFGAVTSLAVSADSADVFATIPCSAFIHCTTGAALEFDVPMHQPATVLNTSNVPTPPMPPTHPSAITLAPAPSAAFSATVRPIGSPSSFDATGSSNPGGSVVNYTWQFGDGTPSVITAAPTVSHAFAQHGSYTVSLTTTNEGGCAATFIFTGQTASCTGSPTATTSRTITIAAPATASTTGSAGNRTTTRALVHGTIGPHLVPVSWQFQYGPSTRYGHTTQLQALAPHTTQVTVSSILRRLTPNTLYHYRLIVETSQGAHISPAVSSGRDRTFTTLATGTLLLDTRVASLVGGRTDVLLRCASRIACRGRLALTIRTRAKARHRFGTVACGSAAIRLRARRNGSVLVSVPARCRSIVQHARHRRMSARVSAELNSGQVGFSRIIRLAL